MANSFSKIKFTEEGGLACWYINKTGGASVKGVIVEVSTGIDNAVRTAATSADHPIGVTYTAGIADGTGMWVVVSGRAEVLSDTGGFTWHDRLITSVTAGSVLVSNTPAAAAHFQEIGHASSTAAASGLGMATIHFL